MTALDKEGYRKLCELSERSGELNDIVLDEILLPYAVEHDRLHKEAEKALARYRRVMQDDPVGYGEHFITQHIAYRLFGAGGLIRKYLQHSALRILPPVQRAHLELLASRPWRFCFFDPGEEVYPRLFRITDLFSGEEMLLYSPSLAKVQAEHPIPLWSGLIGFNGHAWQSFGPLIPYLGFDADDIFFFASELDEDLESPEEVPALIHRDPWPFMMLFSGAAIPPIMHRGEPLQYQLAEYDMPAVDSSGLDADFDIERRGPVTRLRRRDSEAIPGNGVAYYDEDEQLLLLFAYTASGLAGVARALQQHGLAVEEEPFIRVRPSLIVTAENILGKRIDILRYERLFEEEKNVDDEDMDELNRALGMMIASINARETPDYEEIALATGVSEDTLREAHAQLNETLNKNLGPADI